VSQESLDSEVSSSFTELMDRAKAMGCPIGVSAALSFSMDGFKHPVALRSTEWPLVLEWCTEVFGQRNYSWAGSTFAFRTAQDAVMFKLRWG
jgi:hypothetical protein